MSSQTEQLDPIVAKWQPRYIQVKEEIQKVIVGQTALLDRLLIGLLADGHILLEGLPGLAKTLSVNTLAKVIQCEFNRIQFTPDLLPADLTGTIIYQAQNGGFTVKKGPIFTNILLADEINRAPPKVQSALLEVMQEKQVTIHGKTYPIKEPFLVLATQNPIEQEGTYILPEAQTDRLMMKVLIDYPNSDEEKEILSRMGRMHNLPEPNAVITGEEVLETRHVVDQIYIDEKVTDYLLNVIFATRHPEQYGVKIEGLLQFGASPRASIHLKMAAKAHAFLSGRSYVTPQDIKNVGPDVLRHRLRRTYEAEAEGVTPDEILSRIFDTLYVP